MSGPVGSSQWGYATGDYYEYKIPYSLRLDDDAGAYLNRTPGSAGDRRAWTLSFWLKWTGLEDNNTILKCPGSGDTGFFRMYFNTKRFWASRYYGGAVGTNREFRDPAAWTHFVFRHENNISSGTAADRWQVFVNGVRETDLAAVSNSGNTDDAVNNNQEQQLFGSSGSEFMDGYVADIHMLDGIVKEADAFGEFGDYGDWKPKEYVDNGSTSHGAQGYHLDFALSNDLGNDVSGNNNDFSLNNISSHDQMLDSPTNNFCVWHSIKSDEGIPNATRGFAQGNLQCTTTGLPYGAANGRIFGTIGVTSGKWYWEWIETVDASSVRSYIGWADHDHSDEIAYGGDGTLRGSGSNESYGATWDIGDIIGIAFNADTNQLTCYKNGASQGEITISDNHTFGTNQAYFPFVWDGSGNPTITGIANFGQDSSFAGNKTAQGNQDSNDIGDFYYTPPSGYLALCTSNMPDVAANPQENFKTVIYTGDGSEEAVTGVGFQPDLIWVKARNAAVNNKLFDSIRGLGSLRTNTTGTENTTGSENLTSYDSDGFTIKDPDYIVNSRTVVAWNWNAGPGSTVTNTAGTEDTQIRANVAAGFSIVKWTNDGNETGTRGHGLSQAPEMIITKIISGYVGGWGVYHKDVGNDKALRLDGTQAEYSSTQWNSTTPTSTVFSVGVPSGYADDSYNNPIIAYCFHSVEGYCKVGQYLGNGAAGTANEVNGTFVYTGFKPAWILVRRTDAGSADWICMDNVRNAFNITTKFLNSNTTDAEETASSSGYEIEVDFVSNGFKWRGPAGNVNSNGNDFVYLAMAETPFKYANAS